MVSGPWRRRAIARSVCLHPRCTTRTADNSPRPANLESPELVVREINRLVRDLHGHKPWIYWTDLLLLYPHWTGGAFLVILPLDGLGWKLAGFFVTALAVYRCSMFIHELQHLRAGTFRGFKVAWNLLCGIPT